MKDEWAEKKANALWDLACACNRTDGVKNFNVPNISRLIRDLVATIEKWERNINR